MTTWRFEGDLMKNLEGLDEHVKKGMAAAALYVAPQAEQYMKNNAKWTDRTGAARSGLGAKPQLGANSVAIVLYHSVPYGIWLEVRWGGKYAIIEPTIHSMAPLFLQAIARLAFND